MSSSSSTPPPSADRKQKKAAERSEQRTEVNALRLTSECVKKIASMMGVLGVPYKSTVIELAIRFYYNNEKQFEELRRKEALDEP